MEEVCAYDKMCTYKKGALNNPSLGICSVKVKSIKCGVGVILDWL